MSKVKGSYTLAQINLLKQKSPFEGIAFKLPSLVAKLLMVGVLGLAAYYGWQFVKISKIEAQIQDEQKAIVAAQQSVSSVKNRDELYTRQGQLQQLSALIDKHVYWTALFPALAKATLKQAAYSNITATKDGELTLTVTVPDLISLDKFLQVFDQPEFSNNFHNLRVGAFRKVDQDKGSSYSFEVRMDFNTALLQPKQASAAQ